MNAPSPELARLLAGEQLWYKDAIIYQLHVKSFFDANNDGIGDFPGLISKLDYIADLGVNTLWLLPFYPSPRRDDGYDIADYRSVHPEYGKMADVRRFIAAAHKRGLRVITELVINHTSDQHPWFERARHAKPGSVARDFYVWSDTDQKYQGTRVIFIDTERSNWTWDPVAQAYYWHRFYAHQPDLNFDNPKVLEAVLSVMRFWFELGVDGLRLDAVPYLAEREGTNNENLPETHEILKKIRAELDRSYPDRLLLAEANQWPEDTKDYFGNGDECHMAFHFPLMPRMYMALAREDRFPITDIMRQTPQIPETCQWAIFLRNHDELTLEMVTDSERDYLWQTYATDRRARINLGIRRRLAPLLERDRRRVELMNCLLLSMPGTPVIYYGDEIGMGDNIRLGDRDGVRTPMQWSPDRNGGFSRADWNALALPTIQDPLYGYETVNVEAQSRDPYSLLHWMRRMLTVRRGHAALGRGTLRFLYPKNRKVLAYLREHVSETILCVANVSRTPQAVELDLSEFAGRVPVEMSGGSEFPPVGQLPYLLTLPPYGFYWFILAKESEAPAWHTPVPEPMPDYVTLVLRERLAEAVKQSAAILLERDALPAYLTKRRWFSAKGQKIEALHFAYVAPLPGGDRELLMAEIETRIDGATQRWQMPLSMVWEDETTGPLPGQLALSRVRRGRRVGLLTDAFAVPSFATTVLQLLANRATIETDEGRIVFEPMPGREEVLRPRPDATVTWLSAEQSNSSLIVDDVAMLKIFRRVTAGEHPEAEMSRYLTSHGFANAPTLMGEVTRFDQQGERHSLAVVQAFIRNQGDAWTWTLDQFKRTVDDLAKHEAAIDARTDNVEDYKSFIATIGRQLAAMHLVLARETDDPAFAPQTATEQDVAHWIGRALALLAKAFDIIGTLKTGENEPDDTAIAALTLNREALTAALQRLAQTGVGGLMTRVHGDFHLGQVLVASGDAYLIDFEGEPARPLAERRARMSPLVDVAGLMRSLDYAVATTLDPRTPTSAPLPEATRAKFVKRLRDGAQEAFLEAYRAGAGHLPGLDNPDLLTFFMLEKAAYELVYEANNRPAWLTIPLHGLQRLTARILGDELRTA
ncbi:MAG TPA: maltose alpha-D-glucosyltransferase [Reyranella sp.]|nr:maltose alpha-D-glucosyltransferase [Reyranella sp.]